MTYSFSEIVGPSKWTINVGFETRADAERFARGWLQRFGIEIVLAEADDIDDGYDFMTNDKGALRQFGIDRATR